MKESFVIFDISVNVNSKKTREMISGFLVKRRFREFDNLHQRLKKKFVKYSRPLPDFPKKFGFKVNNKKRQFKLENYLRLLLNYTDIFECVCFRQFLQIQPKKFNELRVNKKIYTSESGSRNNGDV
jgi:hypothetical protein